MIAAAARRSVGISSDVAEFAGHPGHAMPDAALQNDSAAHAGSKGDHAHVVNIGSGSQPLFAQRGRIGVVFQDYVGA